MQYTKQMYIANKWLWGGGGGGGGGERDRGELRVNSDVITDLSQNFPGPS